MKSFLLLILVIISMFFVSNTQAEFCNLIGPCGEGRCCSSWIFGYCQPLGQLNGPCDTETELEKFCGCAKGLKCVNKVCKTA